VRSASNRREQYKLRIKAWDEGSNKANFLASLVALRARGKGGGGGGGGGGGAGAGGSNPGLLVGRGGGVPARVRGSVESSELRDITGNIPGAVDLNLKGGLTDHAAGGEEGANTGEHACASCKRGTTIPASKNYF